MIEARGLVKTFAAAAGQRPVTAVRGVDLEVGRGEVVGLVGESGCGKTTLGRCLLRLSAPTAGTVRLDGIDITRLSQRRMRPLRSRMQLVFQDPVASLDPRMTIEATVTEPLAVGRRGDRAARRERARRLLRELELPDDALGRYPHQLSGGQRQRVGIARALISDPEFVVADEPVTALDVVIQAQILELLRRQQRRRELAMLLISHDLRVVQRMCARVAVMYLGLVVEQGPSERVIDARAGHPYTRALVGALPRIEPACGAPPPERLGGEPPSPRDPPPGCPFHPRCPVYAERGAADCVREPPPLRELSPGHLVACHEAPLD